MPWRKGAKNQRIEGMVPAYMSHAYGTNTARAKSTAILHRTQCNKTMALVKSLARLGDAGL